MIVPHTFALDDATLSGGAAIVAAGSGLPIRITGQIDYEALVLGLNPTGYWPSNEASGQARVDRTANARNLAYANGTTSQVAGHTRGGASRTACRLAGSSNLKAFVAAANYAEHNMVAGTPFTVMVWYWAGANQYNIKLAGTKNSPTDGVNTAGWQFNHNASGLEFQVGNGAAGISAAAYWQTGAPSVCDGAGPYCLVYRYSGGALNGVGSHSIRISGREIPLYFTGTATTTAAAYALYYLSCASAFGNVYTTGDLAIWAGTRLSDAQADSLASATPCGTARWTLPVAAYDRTLKGFTIPGSLARSISSTESRLGVRAYYQIGAGARTEFDPGDDLDVAIPAGEIPYLEAELTHHHLDDLPWIGDSLGGGPVVLVEEPDPAPVTIPVPSGELTMEVQDRSTISMTIQDRSDLSMEIQDVTA